ncbi:hypothetical protein N7481_001756 [Penicillium waksmanii]|uniref:uncharacterized protein n=1 Tax=Penicillium waksmanii TaxID=69791 RepID=UPI00254951E5|nr:uncharacterized protein N7481_001756 [Penicillium waksmanii]KAJ5994779.1 hypothetical protein N7481_001756 [Penicillium waksmanii]
MASPIWWLSVALYTGLGQAVSGSSSSSTTSQVTCTDTTVSTNLLSNPSWEDGTSSWTYSFAASTTTLQETDGSHALYEYPHRMKLAHITCNIYLYHDALTTANLIEYKAGTSYNRYSQWSTVSGPFTATSSSALFGFYAVCSPYHTNNIFNLYLDNAKLIAETTTQVCTTATPTSISTSTSTSTSTSISTSLPKPSSAASSIASSSIIGHSSSAALTPTSKPLIPSSSSVLSSSISTQTPSVSSLAKPHTPTTTPVTSSTAVLSVSSQSIGHSSSSVKPSTPSIPTGSTSLTATTSTQTSTVLQSTSPISNPSGISIFSPSTISSVPSSSSAVAPVSTTVTSTESNQQRTTTSPLGPASTPSSPVDLPPTTSSGHTTTTSVALTTSTIYSTRTSTITACPSNVADCPARSQTTYVTIETIYVTTTICPVSGNEPTAQAASTGVPQDISQPSERYTTLTVFTPHTVTATACLSGGNDCPGSVRTTFVTTELAASTTVFVVTEKETSLPTDSPVISVSVSPILSTRTATITSCPPEVTGCSANPAAPQVVTETLLVGESICTLSEIATATYSAHTQIVSTPSSRMSSSVPVSHTTQALSSNAEEHSKNSGSKTTLSISTTLPYSSTSTGTSNVPAFNGGESLGRPMGLAQVIVSVAIAGLALLALD